MPKALISKRTDVFSSEIVSGEQIAEVLTTAAQEKKRIVALVPLATDSVRAIFVKTTTEQIEVDVPEEVESLESLAQADGCSIN